MILDRETMTLRPDDEIKKSDRGGLVVTRIVELAVCRCRECDDECQHLAAPSYVLCVHCNNNHSQKADPNNTFSEYLGPLRGQRKGKP